VPFHFLCTYFFVIRNHCSTKLDIWILFLLLVPLKLSLEAWLVLSSFLIATNLYFALK
jgi:hypothetical protein